MNSFGFHILLNDKETAEQYIQYHKNVWPEVEAALKKIGVKKMRIFFVDDLKLFMYIETIDGFNPEKDFDLAVQMDPKVEEWVDIMNTKLLKRLNPNEGSLVWHLMDDIYDFSTEKS